MSKSLILSLAVWFLFAIILPIIAVFVAFAVLGPIPTGVEPEMARKYFRKMTEISSMVTSITPELHVNSIMGALNSVYRAEIYATGMEGSGNQTEVISEIIGEMELYPNIFDALAASWVNMVVLIAYTAVFYIASYVAFVARKIEK